MLIRRARADESAALLLEQIARRACARRGGFNRGGGRGGMVGPRGVGAPDPRLLLFSDGTFTRSTEASLPLLYQPGDTITWIPPDTLRQSSLRTPDGLPYFAFEGSRTQQIGQSESITQISGATETQNVGGDPDGGSEADRLTITANGGYGRDVRGQISGQSYAGSFFVRHVGGDANWLARFFVPGPGFAALAFVATSQWKRITPGGGACTATSNGILQALENGAGDDNVVDLWGWQVEEGGIFASSYIRATADTAVTRAADNLSYAAAPASLNEAFTLRVRPSFSGAQIPTSGVHALLATGASSGDRLVIWNDAGTRKVSVYAGGVLVVERAFTVGSWTSHVEMSLTLDPVAGSLTVTAGLAGDGTTVGTPWTWDTASTLRVGAYVDGSNPYFGLLSEPVAA